MVYQWFPGHMQKAFRMMEEDIKLIDLVIELVDARAPLATRNPDIDKLAKGKARMMILNKEDLADPTLNDEWTAFYNSKGYSVVRINSRTGEGINRIKPAIQEACRDKTERDRKRGIKNRPVRAMVVGIPNVGKSSLINRLAGMNHAKIENKPGVTRAKQWIKIADGLDLLDMPGILYPKFDDADVALKLSWTYAISDEIHDLEPTVCKLLEVLAEKFPAGLVERYKIEISGDGHEILNKIGLKRGCIKKGGVLDTDKALRMILSEFRAGKLGKVNLD